MKHHSKMLESLRREARFASNRRRTALDWRDAEEAEARARRVWGIINRIESARPHGAAERSAS